jgi:hypothetical protein
MSRGSGPAPPSPYRPWQAPHCAPESAVASSVWATARPLIISRQTVTTVNSAAEANNRHRQCLPRTRNQRRWLLTAPAGTFRLAAGKIPSAQVKPCPRGHRGHVVSPSLPLGLPQGCNRAATPQ